MQNQTTVSKLSYHLLLYVLADILVISGDIKRLKVYQALECPQGLPQSDLSQQRSWEDMNAGRQPAQHSRHGPVMTLQCGQPQHPQKPKRFSKVALAVHESEHRLQQFTLLLLLHFSSYITSFSTSSLQRLSLWRLKELATVNIFLRHPECHRNLKGR